MFDLPEPEESELPEELQKAELNWPFIDYVRDGAVVSPVAAVEFNGSLQIFYVRRTENGNVLAHTQFTGKSDKNRVIKVVDGPEIASMSELRPAVAVYNDLLYCIYVRTDMAMWCSTYDGIAWNGPHSVEANSVIGPGVAVTDVRGLELTLIFQEEGPLSASYNNDGKEWHSMNLAYFNPDRPQSGVAVAAFKGTACVAFNDVSAEGACIMPMPNGSLPLQLEVDFTYLAVGSPSLCASHGKLYCATTHAPTNACLISSYPNPNSDWSEPQAIHGLRLKGSPCLAEFKGSLYLLSVNTVGVDIFKKSND
ncbi:hypothetical protein [Pseudomonas mucidolens]|uniref:Exo-alpha-sialidase n=1 Tax=Pseudomonas mucidolens TaxID=46679 RepID=A0A1H2P1Y6_9PSED|nr:hypothetical protein [Pseudomonas mucidolens]SDV11660.1 hypothetical protein SAMN05216202_5320 [Pseudomonas mucidolens]SQH36548.1 Uncharacterised protein [Pseudomonas mucidolens]